MQQIETIKQNLVGAIEECAWVVEGGDAHDLIDAVEQAHAAMAEALACIQYFERVQHRLSNGIDLQCATCKHLKEGVAVKFGCKNPNCEEIDGRNSQWEWCGIQ